MKIIGTKAKGYKQVNSIAKPKKTAGNGQDKDQNKDPNQDQNKDPNQDQNKGE